ncbi:MAG: M56 family metallopeptidase [Bacteroidota bacterium]
MMLYLLISVCFSCIGYAFYLMGIKNRRPVLHQRRFLYVVIASSLLIPLPYLGEEPKPRMQANGEPFALVFGQVPDQASLQQFCHCEAPDYGHRIQFQANAWYTFLLAHKQYFYGLLILGLSVVVAKGMAQVWYLRHLSKKFPVEPREEDGLSYFQINHPAFRGPAAFRWRKAYVIFPAYLEGLAKEDQQAILAHELSHLHQFNTLENLGLNLLQIGWFFNPAFYLIRRQLHLLSEYQADEAGVDRLGSRKAYAHLLLRMKALQQENPLGTGFAAFVGGDLKKRIQHILAPKPARASVSGLWLAGVLWVGLQIWSSPLLAGNLSSALWELGAYEAFYPQLQADQDDGVYCQDCETVCLPEEAWPQEELESK